MQFDTLELLPLGIVLLYSAAMILLLWLPRARPEEILSELGSCSDLCLALSAAVTLSSCSARFLETLETGEEYRSPPRDSRELSEDLGELYRRSPGRFLRAFRAYRAERFLF